MKNAFALTVKTACSGEVAVRPLAGQLSVNSGFKDSVNSQGLFLGIGREEVTPLQQDGGFPSVLRFGGQ